MKAPAIRPKAVPPAVPPQARQAVALLRDAVGPQPVRFGLVVAAAIATAALESAALVMLPDLLGAGLPGAAGPGILPLGALGLPARAGLYLALVGLAAHLLYVQAVAANRLTLDFGERLRLRLHEAVMRARWGSLSLARPSEITHALTAEAAQCAVATQVAIGLATRLVHVPALLGAALLLSPGLALAALALGALAGLPMILLARRAYGLAAVLARASTRFHAGIADDLAGLKTLKMLGAEERRHDAFRAQLDAFARAQAAQTRAGAIVRSWQRFAAATAAVAGAFYGLSVLGLGGAAMVALALAIVRLAGTLSQALDQWRQLGRLLPVYGLLAAREAQARADREPVPAAEAPRLRRALHLRGVGLTHPGAAGPTLAEIDLVLPARSLTALTGPSGAGKSTLADLVMGLTAPSAGEILVDGRALDAAGRAAWRGRVAHVAQEPFLFDDTIRANLLLARPDATEADLHRVLDEAAAGFVRQWPDGLDTRVGDRGSRLSGGERQRLMIARAILREPDLLVLDEATNALDPESEALVNASLRRLAERMTILAVAHRSAVIAAADRVIAIENGRVVPSVHAGTDREEAPAGA